MIRRTAAIAAFVVGTLHAAPGPNRVDAHRHRLCRDSSDTQVNNPYGLIFGPDGALYFCDLDNQRIRRLDLKTQSVTTIAGNGEKGYRGDGGPGHRRRR